MGGGIRCSRRHSPRSSKIVAAESRTDVPGRSTDGFVISATVTRLDVVAADAIIGLQGCERETELPFHRACQKAAHAVLLPAGCLHQLFDAGPLRLAEESEHAL
jgi:hypothetical protein